MAANTHVMPNPTMCFRCVFARFQRIGPWAPMRQCAHGQVAVRPLCSCSHPPPPFDPQVRCDCRRVVHHHKLTFQDIHEYNDEVVGIVWGWGGRIRLVLSPRQYQYRYKTKEASRVSAAGMIRSLLPIR